MTGADSTNNTSSKMDRSGTKGKKEEEKKEREKMSCIWFQVSSVRCQLSGDSLKGLRLHSEGLKIYGLPHLVLSKLLKDPV